VAPYNEAIDNSASNDSNEADNGPITVYNFDTITIDSAFEFRVEASLEFDDKIIEKTGTGELRVIIAEFTVAFTDGSISDTIIVVVGEKGMYHCMLNTYYESAQSLEFGKNALEFRAFSPHKYFKGKAIEKNNDQADSIIVYRYADNVFAMEYVFNLYSNYDSIPEKEINEYVFVDGSYLENNTAEVYTLFDFGNI